MTTIAASANATSQAVAEFSRNASLKVSDAGAGETRTQRKIDQMNAQVSADMRSGRSSPLLSSGVLSALTSIQANRA